jgi:hypothetical protein
MSRNVEKKWLGLTWSLLQLDIFPSLSLQESMAPLSRGYTISESGVLVIEGLIEHLEYDAETDRILVLTTNGVITIPRTDLKPQPTPPWRIV